MKDKIIKFGLIMLSVFSIFIACFSSAVTIECKDFDRNSLIGDYGIINVIGNEDCFVFFDGENDDTILLVGVNSIENTEYGDTTIGDTSLLYKDENTNYLYGVNSNVNPISFDFYSEVSKVFTVKWRKLTKSDFYNIFNSGYTCQFTSLECQSEYNLIPIEDVTENYCTSNFNLISPADCPTSGGTGDVNWSSVWINNQQVVGSPNIFLNIYDRLDRSQTYVNQDMYIDVNGPEGDEDYINGIIAVNSYRPTSEDFTSAFVGGLTLILPYVVIALFIIFVRKLIRKIFK